MFSSASFPLFSPIFDVYLETPPYICRRIEIESYNESHKKADANRPNVIY